MQAVDIPYAAGVINFIVLVAALSAMNSQLYITTRMMFSLSRAAMRRPRWAAYAAAAAERCCCRPAASPSPGAERVYPETSFTLMMMAISVRRAVHLDDDLRHALFLPPSLGARRRARLSFRMPGFPALLTLLGALAMLAILLTTYFTSVFK